MASWLKCFILWINTRLASNFSSFLFLKFQQKLFNSLQRDLEGKGKKKKKKTFSHVKYILVTEYSHVLRLPLKMYQGDGPG